MRVNRHCPDSYIFKNKTRKAVIYVAGAHRYSKQMNRRRSEPNIQNSHSIEAEKTNPVKPSPEKELSGI